MNARGKLLVTVSIFSIIFKTVLQPSLSPRVVAGHFAPSRSLRECSYLIHPCMHTPAFVYVRLDTSRAIRRRGAWNRC